MDLKFSIGDYIRPKRDKNKPSGRIVAYGYHRSWHFSYWILEDGSMILTSDEDKYEKVKL